MRASLSSTLTTHLMEVTSEDRAIPAPPTGTVGYHAMVIEPSAPLMAARPHGCGVNHHGPYFYFDITNKLGSGPIGVPCEVVCWELGSRASALLLGCPDPRLLSLHSSTVHTLLRDLRSPADWGVGAQEPDPSCLVIWELPRG